MASTTTRTPRTTKRAVKPTEDAAMDTVTADAPVVLEATMEDAVETPSEGAAEATMVTAPSWDELLNDVKFVDTRTRKAELAAIDVNPRIMELLVKARDLNKLGYIPCTTMDTFNAIKKQMQAGVDKLVPKQTVIVRTVEKDGVLVELSFKVVNRRGVKLSSDSKSDAIDKAANATPTE